MEKQSINSAKKSVKVSTNGAAAAFAKDTPQCYYKSEAVIDSAFVNEVVGHLVATIFSSIEAGVSLAQQNQRARDERALWLREHNLTAGEVADLLYVPGYQQVMETVEVPVANKEVKSEQQATQETVETAPAAKEEPKQSKRHHNGWKHRKPQAVPQTTMPNAAVPSTVKRPTRSPMENLKNIVMRDPSLGQELLAVLHKHDVSIDQIFKG